MKKVITLWQPWARLLVLGEKKIETRSWNTNIRGETLIHASSKSLKYLLQEPYLSDVTYDILSYCPDLNIDDLPLGAIIGSVNIIDCVPIEKLFGTEYDTPKERAFGDWSPGRFGWIMNNNVLFDKPIPAKGHQGFWNWRDKK